MPVKDGSVSRARLVDGRYNSYISKKTGRGSEDIIASMEDSLREDQHQYIKGED